MLLEKSNKNTELKLILLEIAELFGGNNIEKAIEKFERILAGLKLPKIIIKSKDIQALSESINIERMKNNPVIFSKEEIIAIYNDIK